MAFRYHLNRLATKPKNASTHDRVLEFNSDYIVITINSCFNTLKNYEDLKRYDIYSVLVISILRDEFKCAYLPLKTI